MMSHLKLKFICIFILFLPLCFFVYIIKNGDGYRFFTYEKTLGLLDDGIKGSIGEWFADGNRRNLGFYTYTDDEAQFLADMDKLTRPEPSSKTDSKAGV